MPLLAHFKWPSVIFEYLIVKACGQILENYIKQDTVLLQLQETRPFITTVLALYVKVE